MQIFTKIFLLFMIKKKILKKKVNIAIFFCFLIRNSKWQNQKKILQFYRGMSPCDVHARFQSSFISQRKKSIKVSHVLRWFINKYIPSDCQECMFHQFCLFFDSFCRIFAIMDFLLEKKSTIAKSMTEKIHFLLSYFSFFSCLDFLLKKIF